MNATPVCYTEIRRCRACQGADLEPVLDLGNLAISDFLEPGQAVERAPLELVRCAGCGLVQLRHTVDRDRLYRRYHYRSSVNETMVDALKNVVADAMSRVELRPGDDVLDIGCNDGTLLKQYPIWVDKIGFDPSDVALDAWEQEHRKQDANDYTLHRDYFPTTRQHLPVACKIITAIACFYDVEDPGRFLEEVKRWLHPEGVLVLQLQDLWSMVNANAIDNVCHEHLTYWDEATLERFARRHGLALVDWCYPSVNGGSLRVTFRRATEDDVAAWHPNVTATDLAAFACGAQINKSQTVGLLQALRDEGKTVYGLAASTKFNTLSQFYGIGPALLTAIGERSPHKVGKTTVTGIPIISEEALRAAKPDYLFVGAWGFADAFAERERDLLASGTKLIVPLPTLRVEEGARANV